MKIANMTKIPSLFLTTLMIGFILLQTACEQATENTANNAVNSHEKVLTSTPVLSTQRPDSVTASGQQTAEEAAIAAAQALTQASKDAIEAQEDGDSDCD